MNTRNWMFVCGIAAALALPLQAQADAKNQAPKPVAKSSQKSAAAVGRLIEDLGADEYELRKAAEKALADLGSEAKKQLLDAAKNHADTEVRWRARRLADRLNGKGRGLVRVPKGGRKPAQKDSKTLRKFGLGPDASGHLRAQLEELQARLEAMRAAEGGAPMPGLDLQKLMDGSSRGAGVGQSSKIQISPDGVRVEVSETGKDGKAVPKVYEAKDMDAFRVKHPEVAERYLGRHGAMNFSVDMGPGRQSAGLQILRPRLPLTLPAPLAPPKGRTLGVMVGAVPEQIAQYLELERGDGLLVNSVVAGSLAASIGVLKGDIITRIGSRTIRGRADVARALGVLDKGEKVSVKVIRRGRDIDLKGEKREDGALPSKTLQPKKQQSKSKRVIR